MVNVEEINWLRKKHYIDANNHMTIKGISLASDMSFSEIVTTCILYPKESADIITTKTALNAMDRLFPKPVDLLLALTENERKQND